MNVLSQISWGAITRINAQQCSNKKATHGYSSENKQAAIEFFELNKSLPVLNLAQAADVLKDLHRLSPFLFFNGNTFATVGRQLLGFYYPDKVTDPSIKSILGHHIAGTCILDQEDLLKILPPENAHALDSNTQPMLERYIQAVADKTISLEEAKEQTATLLDIKGRSSEGALELTLFELQLALLKKMTIPAFLSSLETRRAVKRDSCQPTPPMPNPSEPK